MIDTNHLPCVVLFATKMENSVVYALAGYMGLQRQNGEAQWDIVDVRFAWVFRNQRDAQDAVMSYESTKGVSVTPRYIYVSPLGLAS
jgi:hypothetical protein